MPRLSNCLFFLLLACTGSTNAETASAPPHRLATILAGIDSLHARYDQSTDTTDDIQTGEIWLHKPDRFRVNSGPPLSQTVVSDGTSLWTFDRDLEQVIISDLQKNSPEIPVQLFAGDPANIADYYTVDYFADETREHYLLKPRDETGLLSALALTFEAGMPVRIVVENAMSERTTVHLYNQSGLDPEDDDLFAFTVPEDVDVIDDRER